MTEKRCQGCGFWMSSSPAHSWGLCKRVGVRVSYKDPLILKDWRRMDEEPPHGCLRTHATFSCTLWKGES